MKVDKTVPVLANRAPWNELVLRGDRRVKTLPFNWKHRGPVLLYTSANRSDYRGAAENYPSIRDTPEGSIPRGAIVGWATVADVVPTCDLPESFYLEDPGLCATDGQAYVVVVEGPRRFKRPVPYKPPQGSVRISRAPAALLRRKTV